MTEPAAGHKPALLVTGAAGMLGAEIARQAAATGFSCRSVDRQPPLRPDGGEAHTADILVSGALDPLLDGVDAVIHAAGITPYSAPGAGEPEFLRVNLEGTAAVARSAATARVPRLVLVSSVSVYGSQIGGRRDEQAPCRPESAYARSKLGAERVAEELVRGTATQLIILRLATLYGGEGGNVRRLARWIARRRFFWIGDGANRKSLIHFEDAARSCLLAATGREPPAAPAAAVYNVSAPAVSMREVVSELARILDVPVADWGVPSGPARAVRAALGWVRLPGDRRLPGHRALDRWLSDEVHDGSRFAEAYGFTAQVTLREGMAREAAAVSPSIPGPGLPPGRSSP